MTALAADRNTPWRQAAERVFPVGAAKKIYAGSMVALASTLYAEAATGAAGKLVVGRAEEQVDNSGGLAGDKSVRVSRGVFRWANSAGGDAISNADIGRYCYAVDDQTVAKTDNAGGRSIAGRVIEVDALGVWVETGVAAELSRTASLDFANMAAAASDDQTIAVPGARANDAVTLGLPAAPTAGIVFQAFVSADDVVTVRATNITAGAVNPAAQTIRVTVHKG
jgi:hypothetical protein